MLAKLPALDKGYVALLDSCCNGRVLASLRQDGLVAPNKPYPKVGHMVLVFKCPLFIQLNLSLFNLAIHNTDANDIEAYKPNEGEVGAKQSDLNRLISEDISRTTDALLINPAAYVADGCDPFISQVICPVSVYTTIVVSGSLQEWQRYASQVKVPQPVHTYTSLVQQIIDSEWSIR